MALQPCRECGQQISTEATACPQCGSPQAAPRVRTSEDSALTRSRGCGDIAIFGPIVAILALVFMLRACF